VFTGHIAVGLAAKRIAPRSSLGALLAAALALDAASRFGPPPPSPRVLARLALSAGLSIPLAYWVDRHRQAVKQHGMLQRRSLTTAVTSFSPARGRPAVNAVRPSRMPERKKPLQLPRCFKLEYRAAVWPSSSRVPPDIWERTLPRTC
jgi:hypothetical protein